MSEKNENVRNIMTSGTIGRRITTSDIGYKLAWKKDSASLLTSDCQLGLKKIIMPDGKIAIEDRNGKQIIPPGKYDEIGYYILNIFYVKKDNLYGFIDEKGKEIIPCKYEAYQFTTDEHVIVKYKGFYGMINIKGEEVVPFIYG